MNKKLLKIALSILLLTVMFVLYLLWYYLISPKTFNNFLGTDESTITKVFMLDGNNGNYE